MSFITILLIAIGLSMDSLAVSISGGICMKPFCIKKSLKMALTMGIFQGGMTWLGWAMGIHFSNYITDFDHWIAFVLLSYLGGKMVYESFKEEDSHLITFSSRMLFTLGVATSIDGCRREYGFSENGHLVSGFSYRFHYFLPFFQRSDLWLPVRKNQRPQSRTTRRPYLNCNRC